MTFLIAGRHTKLLGFAEDALLIGVLTIVGLLSTSSPRLGEPTFTSLAAPPQDEPLQIMFPKTVQSSRGTLHQEAPPEFVYYIRRIASGVYSDLALIPDAAFKGGIIRM